MRISVDEVLDAPNPLQRGGLRCHAPIVVVSHSICDFSQREVREVKTGMTLMELAPKTDMPFICYLNGDITLRAEWDYEANLNDVIIYQLLPLGGDGSNPLRTILLLAVYVLAYTYAPYLAPYLEAAGLGQAAALATAQALIAIAGTLLVNVLVPLPRPATIGFNNDTASPTYSITFQGNTARLEGAIPVLYGTNLIYPDFGSQPYGEYINGDMFYHAYFCIGQGNYVLDQIKIDDTDVEEFDEVTFVTVAPGGSQALVQTNIISAPEVSGQPLTFDESVGPFNVCYYGQKTNQIMLDVICPRGLYWAQNDGTLGERGVTWKVEAQLVDDYNEPIQEWQVLGSHLYTDHRVDPIRNTFKYTVTPGRYQVRVTRTNPIVDDNRIVDDLVWESCRCRLTVAGIVNSSATFLAVRVKATDQLNGASQRRFNVIASRKIQHWSPSGGFTPEQVSDSIIWAFVDILRNTAYGEGRPDNRIDLNGIYGLQGILSTRGDTFNYIFDSVVTIQDALSLVARAGRCVPIDRLGVKTMVRDQQKTAPVALFNQRNVRKNSLSINYILRNEDSTDAVDIVYRDERVWDWRTIRINYPGVTTPKRVQQVQLLGITNRIQATNEGNYSVLDAAYRRTFVSFATEMNGLIPGYGDLVVLSHDLPAWAIGGEFTAYNSATLEARTSIAIEWTAGQNHYVMLENFLGGVFGPLAVVQIPGVVSGFKFVAAPPFSPSINFDRERTRFTFGTSNQYGKLLRVIEVRPSGYDTVNIRAVVEDNRVHGGDAPDNSLGAVTANVMADGSPVYLDATLTQKQNGGFVTGADKTIEGEATYYTVS